MRLFSVTTVVIKFMFSSLYNANSNRISIHSFISPSNLFQTILQSNSLQLFSIIDNLISNTLPTLRWLPEKTIAMHFPLFLENNTRIQKLSRLPTYSHLFRVCHHPQLIFQIRKKEKDTTTVFLLSLLLLSKVARSVRYSRLAHIVVPS